jgi:predicted nucleic acid-binding Zn ribbon protein
VTADAGGEADTGAAMVDGQPADTARSAVMAGVVQPRDPAAGVTLTCLVCGAPFVAARRDRRTCSRRCARRDTARRQASQSQEGVCAGCGGVFVGGRSDRRHCDARCRMRAFRRRKRARRAAEQDGAR